MFNKISIITALICVFSFASYSNGEDPKGECPGLISSTISTLGSMGGQFLARGGLLSLLPLPSAQDVKKKFSDECLQEGVKQACEIANEHKMGMNLCSMTGRNALRRCPGAAMLLVIGVNGQKAFSSCPEQASPPRFE